MAEDTTTEIGVKLAAPAQRALANAGITKLEQLTKRKRSEVAAWHGIGTGALKAIEKALSSRGLSFAKEQK